MGRHPRNVIGYEGSLEDLARAVGNMQYDCVGEFLLKLAQDFRRQSDSDRGKGRNNLAQRLNIEANLIERAGEYLNNEVWSICQPRMSKENFVYKSQT